LFREKKQIAICVAAGAMVIAFVLFRYLPLRQRIKAAERIEAAQRLAISKASMEKAQMPVLREQLLALQRRVGNYQTSIPAEADLGAFLQQIADLMSKYNLKEQVIAPRREIAVEGLSCIPVDMQCKGKLAQFFEFYKRMQKLERLIRIEKVKLANDVDFSGQVSMQAEVVIYYKPQSERG
jgi:Tfp pilus assembly protein PilO